MRTCFTCYRRPSFCKVVNDLQSPSFYYVSFYFQSSPLILALDPQNWDSLSLFHLNFLIFYASECVTTSDFMAWDFLEIYISSSRVVSISAIFWLVKSKSAYYQVLLLNIQSKIRLHNFNQNIVVKVFLAKVKMEGLKTRAMVFSAYCRNLDPLLAWESHLLLCWSCDRKIWACPSC